jgi:hypothetical protein
LETTGKEGERIWQTAMSKSNEINKEIRLIYARQYIRGTRSFE